MADPVGDLVPNGGSCGDSVPNGVTPSSNPSSFCRLLWSKLFIFEATQLSQLPQHPSLTLCSNGAIAVIFNLETDPD